MFDLIKTANKLFETSASSCKDILPEFLCVYNIHKSNIPSAQNLMDFMSSIRESDHIDITMVSDYSGSFATSAGIWTESYAQFENDLDEDDDVTATIKITKKVSNGILSVYNLNAFSEFLCNLTLEQVLSDFTKLFNDAGEHISFQVMDVNGSLRTPTISFSDNKALWGWNRNRTILLDCCNDACVFLDKNRVCLTPMDFKIESIEGDGYENISTLFKKLERILSYVYCANTASIVDGNAVLQFDPSSKGYDFKLEELEVNNVIPVIFHWVYGEGNCVDKASVARKIINLYCHSREDILQIDDKILNSIKSNYIIYQNDHADKYIEMKNKISQFIVESTDKIGELSHDVADCFRNNLIAVMVFLLTVILTDTIDVKQLFSKKVPDNVFNVFVLFTGATIAYFVITFFMSIKKWGWLKKSYFNIKKNYSEILDQKDLDEEFNHDAALNDARAQYIGSCIIVSVIWIAFIVLMIWFTVSLKH